MKFYVSFFAVFAVFNFSHLSLAKAEITKAGNYDFSVKSGKQDRSYSLHVPTKYNPKNKYPLVLAFHGAVGDMSLPADDSSYGLKAKADKEGYLIAFPKGYSMSAQGQMTWNAGACCGEAKDQKIDDVAFVKALVKNIKKEVNVDSERIFAVGMSNGGMMSYRLACEAPELFKGVVAAAGTDNTEMSACKPVKSVSILHIHAKDDDHVPYNGGQGGGTKEFKGKTSPLFVSVPQTIKKWVGHYSCSPTSVKILKKTRAICELNGGCAGGVKVQLCSVEDGGHSWPGANKSALKKSSVSSKALSANDVIWDFFRSL